MKKIYQKVLITVLLSVLFLPVMAQLQHLQKGMGNPIIPGYFADPTVKKFGDTYYIYATTDGNGGGFGPSQVWSSKDFVNWTLQDMNWPTTHHYWAPDATLGPDGRYYLYYCQPVEIFGASATTPVGPWTSLLAPGKPIVPNFLVPNVITLDGQTFKDDDGKYYMYWGTWGIYPKHGCGVGLLNPDMKSFAKLAQIPNTDAKEFFEAPFVFKRKGIYYLTYSSGYCEDGTYRVQYATSDHPMGPFKYADDNPILATNADGTVHGPGHQSVLQQGDDFYLIYHRHNNPHNDGGYHRQIAADKIIFDEKGKILKLVPTHTGIGYLAKNVNPHQNLALGKAVTASSVYDPDFKAQFALDDNNGTLWKSKSNIGPAWLQIDLGKTVNVKSVHTQFEYATWYYQYKIEYSLNGKDWKIYADKSRNTQHGSPMIDFGNVKARYLRTTILHTEYPGLNKAIWNVQVFDNLDYKPVMNTQIKKWESLEKYDSKGLLVNLDLANRRVGAIVETLPNIGKLGGLFSAVGAEKPIVDMIEGKKALVFSGRERLKSSNLAPASMLGNSSYTVDMWVLNQEIEKEEPIVSWTARGGDNLTNVTVGYGTSKTAGAAVHLGWADLGYKQVPKANEWHLITVVFDGTMERIYVDGKLDRAERRMLFIKKLTNFLVGGNEDGTAGFSGAIASLKIYDLPLTPIEIEKAYLKGIPNPTTIYADAKNLDYGKIKTWRNEGAALGKFTASGQVEVADVDGKLAVVLVDKAKLTLKDLKFDNPVTTIIALNAPKGDATQLSFSGDKKALRIPGTGQWQQLICISVGGKLGIWIDGVASTRSMVQRDQNSEFMEIEGVGSRQGRSTAIASIVAYDYGIGNAGIANEFKNWKETLSSGGAIASFSTAPSAVAPNMVYMVATKPSLPGKVFEYLFERVGGNEVQWSKSGEYLDFSAQENKSYEYVVKARDNFGNVTRPSAGVITRTDVSLFRIRSLSGEVRAISATKDALVGTSWDGFLGTADTVIQEGGELKLISRNTLWDGAPDTGPFAYNLVKGDFVAQVSIADILGRSQKKAYGANEGGLMVKLPQNGRKLLQSGIMTGWGVGNVITDLGREGRRQSNNMAGWNFYPHLQIQRLGNSFFLRGSSDGKTWNELPGSPITRDDFGSGLLEVGVYHATYGDISGYATFKDFKIIEKK